MERSAERPARYPPRQVAFPALAGNLAPGPALGRKPVFSPWERLNLPREPLENQPMPKRLNDHNDQKNQANDPSRVVTAWIL
jgi:hypothetical protein